MPLYGSVVYLFVSCGPYETLLPDKTRTGPQKSRQSIVRSNMSTNNIKYQPDIFKTTTNR